MHDDFGVFDDETCRLDPVENPFGPEVLPLRSEQASTTPLGMDLYEVVRALDDFRNWLIREAA